MKFTSFIIATAAMLFCTSVLANTQLILPKQSELVLLNGVESNSNNPITLSAGKNQIVFRVHGQYRVFGQFEPFESDLIIVTFEATTNKIEISVPSIRSPKNLKAFNQKPALTLTDATGNAIDFEQAKLMKPGVQISRNYVAEIQGYNHTNLPASLRLGTQMITETPAVAKMHKETALATQKGQQINVAEMLDFWYGQADEKTRKEFKARIKNQ